MAGLKVDVAGSCLTFSSKNIPSEFKANFKFETDNINDENLIGKIIKNEMFLDYLSLYTKTKSLKLNGIVFKEIKFINQQIHSIKLGVDTTDKNGNLIEDYTVNLVGHTIYVLILMRLDESSKDLCVLIKVSRPNIAKQDFLELAEGYFDDKGKFVGAAADLISELLNISLNKGNLINLTELAFGEESNGISTSRNTDERYSLYLHRCNVSTDKINEYEEKINKNTSMNNNVDKQSHLSTMSHTYPGMQIKLVPLGDAWRSTTDCKAINAIFLVHELRYHKLMPKFRAVEMKKSAKFTKIGGLEPTSVGVNIRVKVVQAEDPEKARREGILVGDEEGVILLKLNQEQSNNTYEPGMPLIIRNAKIDMDNGHMHLYVDRWGKIDTNIEGDEGFNFTVLESNNVSSVEFELVLLNNEESENNSGSPEHTTNVSSSRRRGGGSNRRFSRGGGGNGGGGGGAPIRNGGGGGGPGRNRNFSRGAKTFSKRSGLPA